MRIRHAISSALLAALLVSGCTAYDPSAERSRSAQARPGLGTAWGEDVDSPASRVGFDRASRPLAIESLYYNDSRGMDAMAPRRDLRDRTRWFQSEGGYISYGLETHRGGMLPGFTYRDRNYVEGEQGDRYSIRIRNNTDSRLIVVVSVDGLDVLDGRSASVEKNGYVIKAGAALTITGWRRSLDEIAAFRFSSVADSYSNLRHGETRNVGVIGVAAFAERGARPQIRNRSEARRRHRADPFPGAFATPP